jgi:hypothetical protein
MAESAHFSSRRRTAVVLTGEGTMVAYLAGVVKALEAAGVRIDLVLGKGAGALVAAFSAFHAEDQITGKEGVLESIAETKPYRVRPRYRLAVIALVLSFAAFLAPALLGIASIIAFPLRAVLPSSLSEGSRAFLARLVDSAEAYYLPAVALPVIVLFAVEGARWLVTLRQRRAARAPSFEDFPAPLVDLTPLDRVLRQRLWQLVRGTSTEELPPDGKKLGQAYVELLTAGLGQHGFREVVVYALDTDAGEEVPFVLLKDRFAKSLGQKPRASRGEPVDLAGEGAPVFFDALMASLTPTGLAPDVPIKLPRGNRFGGEVHRFASSLLTGAGSIADAVALGAEQIVYVTGAARTGPLSGSLAERLSGRALRAGLEEDLAWAAANARVPIFVIRPEAERLTPFEVSGRLQIGGERLEPSALVAQGERDCERLFLRPVLGEDLPETTHDATVPVAERARGSEWEAGPKEL